MCFAPQVEDELSRSSRPYDVVLLDISMVRKHGDELCQELRQNGCSVPIVAMTGTCNGADYQRFLAIGFDFLLPKPFDQEAMAAVLLQARALGRHLL